VGNVESEGDVGTAAPELSMKSIALQNTITNDIIYMGSQ
jgi:hypothetical protein